MKGEIGEDFAAKDTLLRFKTLEVGNNIVHIAVRHQTLQDVHSLLPDLLRQKNNHGSTPLHEAAAFGNKETIQLLIFLLRSTSSNSSSSSSSSSSTPGAYLLEVNKDGETPFHVALRSRNMAAAQELFSDMKKHHCVMTEILDKKTHSRNETPLHFYVRYCADEHFPSKINRKNGKVVPNQALIQQLIQANVKGIFKADDFEDLNPLMRAAQHGRVLVIYWMLLLYPLSMLEWRDSKGRGFLHHLRLNITENATDRSYTLSICKCILEFPGVADILTCSRDQDGKTPLHLAILDRDFDLAQLILQRYVDEQVESTKKSTVSMKNIEGKAVYDMIKSGPDIPRILKCLMEQASWGGVMCKWDELYKAAINLDVDAIEAKYITSEVDASGDYPNSQDEQGRNILHIALQHHQSCYYEPDAIDAKYRAFIEKAIERFPKLIFQKDQNGDTPLHIAARLLSLFATILLQISFEKLSGVHDESINLLPRPWKVKNSRGQTPLHEAVRTENSHKLDTMLRNMQDIYREEAVSEVNEYGETVFHVLARCDNESHIVSVLEAFGLMQIALWMRDVDGLTPVLRAAHCGQPIMVKKMFTQSRPLSIIKSDYKGRNVLHHLFASTLTKTDELMDLIQHLESNDSVVGVDELILSQDDDGNTPLHLAITAGQNFEVVEHLIRHCAKVKPSIFMEALTKTRNKEGKSIQHLITGESGIPASLKAQLYHFKPPHWRKRMDSNLYEAIKKNYSGRLPRVHDDLHSISHDGSNILHVALRYRQLCIAKWVLGDEMNWELLDEHDIKGDAPLHVAARLPPEDALSFFNDCLTSWDSCYKYSFHREPWKAKNSKGDTYLHEAARFCNYSVIFSEKLNGKDIQDVNRRGETFLHVIAKYATNAAKDFLKNMSEQMQSLIYIRDSEGFTPVLRALQYGRLGVAMLLIQQCPHAVEIPDNKGGTVLHHLKALVVDLVDLVIEIFPVWDKIFELEGIDDLREAQNEDGNTALHLAIIDGDSRKAKFLMEKCLRSENKQELNLVNNDGHSIFDLIASKSHIPAMKKLQSLVSRNYIKERDLMDRVMDNTLYRAAVDGKVQIFESAANDSITDDPESRPPTLPDAYFCSQTPSGSNIVHVALRHGKANILNFINTALQKHPILSIRPDNNGDTPLHLAAESNSGAAIVQSLIIASQEFLQNDSNRAYHAPPWAVKNYKGNFPIQEALQSGNLEVVDALLCCDTVAAYRVNDLGDTPLHSLAKSGFCMSYYEVDRFVEKLLDRSYQAAYAQDGEGLTPLICAARSGRLEIAQAILKHRPQSAYIRDLSGRTFLHHLRFRGEFAYETLDDTFMEMGKHIFDFPEVEAQRLVQDYDGNTPLHYAIINENPIATIVLTYQCVEDGEQREFGLVNKKGQTVLDLLTVHEVQNEVLMLIQKKAPVAALYIARSERIRKKKLKYSANAISVVAALLATITFAAGLQVPGGFNQDDGTPILLREPPFVVFIVANTIAMCISMLCLFLLLWETSMERASGFSIILIRLSIYLTLLAFTMAVFVTTAAKSLWLGILVIGLGFLTFLLTFRFPFITVVRHGVHATTCIKYFIKKVKSKYKRASPTQRRSMYADDC